MQQRRSPVVTYKVSLQHTVWHGNECLFLQLEHMAIPLHRAGIVPGPLDLPMFLLELFVSAVAAVVVLCKVSNLQRMFFIRASLL